MALSIKNNINRGMNLEQLPHMVEVSRNVVHMQEVCYLKVDAVVEDKKGRRYKAVIIERIEGGKRYINDFFVDGVRMP